MTEQFQPGDIVELKSGSPAMTVQLQGTSTVVCYYWDGQYGLKKIEVQPELLKKSDGKGKYNIG